MIDRVAAALKSGKRSALLLRGRCLERAGVEAAGRIAAKTGARLLHDYFTPRMTRGAGLPAVERIPYFAEDIVESLKGLEQIVLVGAPPPVTFFAYAGKPSWVTPDGCELLTLARAAGRRGRRAGRCWPMRWTRAQPGRKVVRVIPDLPAHAGLDANSMGAIIARLMPDDAILSDDSLTAGMGLHNSLKARPDP